MSPSFAGWDDDVLGLASQHATEGLDPSRQAELERDVDVRDLEEFERAVAAIHMAGMATLEAPPAEVLGRLHATAQHRFSSRPRQARWRGATGWLAAAALLAVLLWPGGSPPETGQVRDELLAAGATPLAWGVASQDPLAAAITGDVVWSDAKQAGVMRFEGLPQNDASEQQYQLWIFDPTKPNWEEHPIDGGVFDAPARGELLVSIDPKIEVGQAALFAVTVEPPGGVVVSGRERLLVTAAVP